jgi:hypothetical protein
MTGIDPSEPDNISSAGYKVLLSAEIIRNKADKRQR